eukprot:11166653-Lingulodinium_polyedra.AAC.1
MIVWPRSNSFFPASAVRLRGVWRPSVLRDEAFALAGPRQEVPPRGLFREVTPVVVGCAVDCS